MYARRDWQRKRGERHAEGIQWQKAITRERERVTLAVSFTLAPYSLCARLDRRRLQLLHDSMPTALITASFSFLIYCISNNSSSSSTGLKREQDLRSCFACDVTYPEGFCLERIQEEFVAGEPWTQERERGSNQNALWSSSPVFAVSLSLSPLSSC